MFSMDIENVCIPASVNENIDSCQPSPVLLNRASRQILPRKIIRWLQSLKNINFNIRQVRRDFASGLLVAKIVCHYLRIDICMNNFEHHVTSMRRKWANWKVLLRTFRRHFGEQFIITRELCRAVMLQRSGAAQILLANLYEAFTKHELYAKLPSKSLLDPVVLVDELSQRRLPAYARQTAVSAIRNFVQLSDTAEKCAETFDDDFRSNRLHGSQSERAVCHKIRHILRRHFALKHSCAREKQQDHSKNNPSISVPSKALVELQFEAKQAEIQRLAEEKFLYAIQHGNQVASKSSEKSVKRESSSICLDDNEVQHTSTAAEQQLSPAAQRRKQTIRLMAAQFLAVNPGQVGGESGGSGSLNSQEKLALQSRKLLIAYNNRLEREENMKKWYTSKALAAVEKAALDDAAAAKTMNGKPKSYQSSTNKSLGVGGTRTMPARLTSRKGAIHENQLDDDDNDDDHYYSLSSHGNSSSFKKSRQLSVVQQKPRSSTLTDKSGTLNSIGENKSVKESVRANSVPVSRQSNNKRGRPSALKLSSAPPRVPSLVVTRSALSHTNGRPPQNETQQRRRFFEKLQYAAFRDLAAIGEARKKALMFSDPKTSSARQVHTSSSAIDVNEEQLDLLHSLIKGNKSQMSVLLNKHAGRVKNLKQINALLMAEKAKTAKFSTASLFVPTMPSALTQSSEQFLV